jgi:hypothetical protein
MKKRRKIITYTINSSAVNPCGATIAIQEINSIRLTSTIAKHGLV